MSIDLFNQRAGDVLSQLEETGQLKHFYELTGPMGPVVNIAGRGDVLVLCSNNYLGLANNPDVVAAGIEGLRQYGAGTASVRFICGTFDCHRRIERSIAELVGTEAALTYVSCWNANEALFPTACAPGDVILSDELNHASIIDSCRLTNKKVQREVYPHSDLNVLESKLSEFAGPGNEGVCWVVTDGVFSMEGDVAHLADLVDLCRRRRAILVVDDSHGIGVLGETGRGTPELAGVLGEVDVITGTLGKALGGGAGGYVAGSQRLIDLLQQRSRPGLFSNALPATVACSANKAIEILQQQPAIVTKLHDNVKQVRAGLKLLGYECTDSPTAIIPIMIGNEAEAIRKSARLMELGVMVIGFAFPVVPKGESRLRVQVSAALEPEHIEQALDAFAKL